ncbi:SCF ubiquitin ligase complex subunit, partial [Rhizopus stolonifer]
DLHVMALRYCKRLERLTLAGCSKLTDIGLCTLIDEIGTMLISIDFSDVNQITDKTIFKTASCCPNLQGINLSMSRPQTGITDSSMTALARQCVHLKRVKLSKCINITSESVTSLSQYCSRLFEIDLTNCNIDDLVLISLFDSSQELRELRLGQPEIAETKITERAFMEANITQENCYQQLRFVDLTNISSINDQFISTLVNAAPRIRSLVLNKCPRITDEGALSIAKLGRFLRFLHLGHCSRLTDRSIGSLAMECNRIRYLDLACCTQVTDASIIQIAKNLSKLKRIGLVKCGNLTDLSLEALVHYHAANYNCLERVHLSYCIQLSTKGVAKLLNVCHQLNHLSLTNVPAFLREDLQAYCRTPPKALTDTQRRVFCVYSGKNIQDLSSHLNLLYSHDMTVLFPLQYPLEIMQESIT